MPLPTVGSFCAGGRENVARCGAVWRGAAPTICRDEAAPVYLRTWVEKQAGACPPWVRFAK